MFQGRLVGLDKNRNKLKKIHENIASHNLTCVEVYHFDSTRAVDSMAGNDTHHSFLTQNTGVCLCCSYATPVEIKFSQANFAFA